MIKNDDMDKTAEHTFLQGVSAPSIRLILAALVVGCILPIAVMAAFLIFDFYKNEQAQLITNSISRARVMASVVDRNFGAIQSSLQALSTSNHLTLGDYSGFHARAIQALQFIQAENIAVLDKTGQLLLATRLPFGTPLPKLANPPLFTSTFEAGKPGVSDLFLGSLVDHLTFTIAVPVRREGSTLYSLHATVAPAQLLTVLTEQKLPNNWRASIIDSSGSIVVRSHDMEKFVGKKANKNILQRMSVADEASFESTTQEGIPTITVYSRSSISHWAVALAIPLGEFNTGLRQTLAGLIVATVAALVIGLSIAWFLSGRIAISIAALIKPALGLGSGETLPIPKLHFKEANELRQALLGAATTLHQAKYEAHHDDLTGLANRTLFRSVVDQQLTLCRRNKTNLAILYIDLDGFKSVNDTYGHHIGDQLLVAVSIRIKDAIRDSDIVARLGGDEFAIALVQSDLENAKAFAGRLIEIVSKPYLFGEINAKISASIGVAGYPISATDIDTLLKNADHAMYKAKALGKRRVCATTY